MNEILLAYSEDGSFTVDSLRVIPLSRYREVKRHLLVATLIPTTLYPENHKDTEVARLFNQEIEGGMSW